MESNSECNHSGDFSIPSMIIDRIDRNLVLLSILLITPLQLPNKKIHLIQKISLVEPISRVKNYFILEIP